MASASDDFAEQRRRLAHDFHRPRYHFVAPANWMNDPNGVIQWDAKFHLFYQYNPESASFGRIHWGHAVSDDLVHWGDLPIALAPTPGSPDERGCWSGCAVNHDGVPTILYTGVQGDHYERQTQCVATSRDGLLTWDKHPDNPILTEIPPEAGNTHDFRDPFVWREGDSWRMLLASRIVGVGGTVFLYHSSDLIRWEFMRPLLTGSIDKNGSVWECPSYFPLDDKWVLIVAGKGGSIPFTVFYFVGEYSDQRFTPETEGILDYGCFYAPFTMQDHNHRRLLWGWLREGRSIEAHMKAGWAGAHSIPRVLSLRDGRLNMEPVAELNALRGEQADFTNIPLSAEDQVLDVRGLALDIAAEFETSGTVGLALACAPDGSEQTRISYDPETRRLIVTRDQSSSSDGVDLSPDSAALTLSPGETLQLRILLDGSVLEIIANGRASLCSRIYPTCADSQGLRVFGHGTLKRLSVWQMRSIWPE